MAEIAALLAALQHGDSQFPSGGFAFSWGLEGLLADRLVARRDLAGFIEGQFRHRWSSFDRVVIAHAHDLAGDLDGLVALDDLTDAATPAAAAREGSRRAGNALLGVHARLGTAGAQALRAKVQADQAHGHVPVVQGMVLAGVGLARDQALAVAAHAMATAFCTAAIRLGLASHLDAQRAIGQLRPLIAELAARPLPALDQIHAFTPAAEIAMMRHAGQDLRLFSN
ncbi:urease accessory protein UreF [Geminicoccus roseus]|uniref:urease accessory protein UreF n=1 Tax=Geminicoccus roseus TaxID=404900 RepID=UPI000410E552|nr:urease accessory UreF family protein [Geminicoccus roseus]